MGNRLCSAVKRQTITSRKIEERLTRPQRATHTPTNVDCKKLRKLILNRKIAPCFDAVDEAGPNDCLDECPICFFFYPSLNRSRCCKKGICTECFLQMKPANPGIPALCPFCKTSSYAVEYYGARSYKERVLEQVEEQKVIEAKIRIQLQESQSTTVSPVSSSSHLCETRDGESSILTSWRQRRAEYGVDAEELMMMEAIWQSIQESSLQKSTIGHLSPEFQSKASCETSTREYQSRMGSTTSRGTDIFESESSSFSENIDCDGPQTETESPERCSTTEEDSWESLSACVLEKKRSLDSGLILDEESVSSSFDILPDASSSSRQYSDKYKQRKFSDIAYPATDIKSSNGIPLTHLYDLPLIYKEDGNAAHPSESFNESGDGIGHNLNCSNLLNPNRDVIF